MAQQLFVEQILFITQINSLLKESSWRLQLVIPQVYSGPDLDLWGPLGRLSCRGPQYDMYTNFHGSDHALFRRK